MSSPRSGSEDAAGARQLALAVTEPSQTGEARRAAVQLAEELGFDETGRGEVAIVATEAATNLVKHASHGELILRARSDGARRGLELIAVDRGPGLADPGRVMGDGFSTAGTAGTGLGAMRRLAAAFDLYSVQGAGTTVVAVLWADDPQTAVGRAGPAPGAAAAPQDCDGLCELGVVSLPHPGERVCGDAWAVRHTEHGSVVLVADGLGHGPLAAEAAAAVVASFRAGDDLEPTRILERAHEAARSTRGAAVAVARVDVRAGTVRYAGVGNIVGTIVAGGRQQGMVSHNGTLGHALRKASHFDYPWTPGAVLVMHSDGLTANWQLDRYPGLVMRHPALLAATLWRDASRGRDDATVLVLREREREARA